MGRKRSRWSKGLSNFLPLRLERQLQPRFDADYVDDDGAHGARSAADGSVVFDAGNGRWKIEDGDLFLTTATCSCDGAVGLSAIYLFCSDLEGGSRAELVLSAAAG